MAGSTLNLKQSVGHRTDVPATLDDTTSPSYTEKSWREGGTEYFFRTLA